ncbi:hypothetical protein JB92DRAFT_2901042 [Gautieria morchelliformis]|nr:hypothetical protein JB92DRAFT_2901042 [Gautieria morchelliformis]
MSHPPPGASDLSQAKTFLDALKGSFVSTWQDTERTLEFLIQILQRQTQDIESLQENVNILNRQNQEKSDKINSLEAQRAELEGSVAEKQNLLIQVVNDHHKLKMALSRFQELQNKMGGLEANYQGAVSEVASLRIKLQEAEERALSATTISKQTQEIQQASGLTNEQIKLLVAALKNELEDRNGAVRKAAQDAIENLRSAYVASQARVRELEEELQKRHNGDTVLTEAPANGAGDQDEVPSSNNSASHIFSGNYRPKHSPTLERQDGNAAAASSASPLVSPAPSTIPPPVSHQGRINPSSSSAMAYEVIDLTE